MLLKIPKIGHFFVIFQKNGIFSFLIGFTGSEMKIWKIQKTGGTGYQIKFLSSSFWRVEIAMSKTGSKIASFLGIWQKLPLGILVKNGQNWPKIVIFCVFSKK
jgi:hypothetical protein